MTLRSKLRIMARALFDPGKSRPYQRPSLRPRLERLEDRLCLATDYYNPLVAGQNLYWSYVQQGTGKTNWVDARGNNVAVPGVNDTAILDGGSSYSNDAAIKIDAGTNPVQVGALITQNNYSGIIEIAANENFVVKNAATSTIADGTTWKMDGSGVNQSKVWFEGTLTLGQITVQGAEGLITFAGTTTYSTSKKTVTAADWAVTQSGYGTDTGTGIFYAQETGCTEFSGTSSDKVMSVVGTGKFYIQSKATSSLFDIVTPLSDSNFCVAGELHDDQSPQITTLCGANPDTSGNGDHHMGLWNEDGVVEISEGNWLKVVGWGTNLNSLNNPVNYYQHGSSDPQLQLTGNGSILDCTNQGAAFEDGSVFASPDANGGSPNQVVSIKTAQFGSEVLSSVTIETEGSTNGYVTLKFDQSVLLSLRGVTLNMHLNGTTGGACDQVTCPGPGGNKPGMAINATTTLHLTEDNTPNHPPPSYVWYLLTTGGSGFSSDSARPTRTGTWTNLSMVLSIALGQLTANNY